MALALPVRNQEAIHHLLAYVDFPELPVEDELARRRDRLIALSLNAKSERISEQVQGGCIDSGAQ